MYRKLQESVESVLETISNIIFKVYNNDSTTTNYHSIPLTFDTTTIYHLLKPPHYTSYSHHTPLHYTTHQDPKWLSQRHLVGKVTGGGSRPPPSGTPLQPSTTRPGNKGRRSSARGRTPATKPT